MKKEYFLENYKKLVLIFLFSYVIFCLGIILYKEIPNDNTKLMETEYVGECKFASYVCLELERK